MEPFQHFSSPPLYLQEDALQSFADVTIQVTDPDSAIPTGDLSTNCLVLSALSPMMKTILESVQNNEDTVILTDFSKGELCAMLKFLLSGSLVQDIDKSVFYAFGVEVDSFFVKKEPIAFGSNNVKGYGNLNILKAEAEAFIPELQHDFDPADEDMNWPDENFDFCPPEGFLEMELDSRDFGNDYEPKKVSGRGRGRPRGAKNAVRAVKDTIKKPKKEYVRQRKHPCAFCPEIFSSRIQQRIHMTQAHGEMMTQSQQEELKFSCDLCDKKFALKIQLINHKKADHDENKGDRYQCVQCGKCIESDNLQRKAEYVQSHIRSFGPFHSNKCAQCPEKLRTYAEYLEHIKEKHNGIYKYVCGFCDEIFDTVELRQHHRGTCSNRTESVCDICGKSVNKPYMKKHYETNHAENQQVECDKCPGKLFRSLTALKHHRAACHNFEQPCEVCGKMFPNSNSLKHHKYQHMPESEWPFHCHLCGKGMTTKVRLKRHFSQVHLGQKRNQKEDVNKLPLNPESFAPNVQ